MERFHVEAREMHKVAPILAACGISGTRRISITASESVELTGNYWDGGCRSYWHFVALDGMRTISAPTMHPVFDAPAGVAVAPTPVVPLPPGVVAVEDSHFGTYRDVTIYANAATIAPMLPAGDSAVSEDCSLVLIATASLKNTYGGETDIRFRRANERRGITRERWNAAQAECIQAGYLNRAGAITPKGRNMIEGRKDRHSL